MDTTWILVADGGRARIFEMHPDTSMVEIQDLTNSLGRFQNRELKTDSEGRFFGHAAQGNTAEPDVSPKMHEATLFAETVSQFLTDHCNLKRYSKLFIIAESKFLGLLREKVDVQVRKLIVGELPKDLSKASLDDIRQHVNQGHLTRHPG